MTLENKIKALEDKAKNNRLVMWEKIKENDPYLADALLEFNRIFGKPKRLRVEINGEVIGDIKR